MTENGDALQDRFTQDRTPWMAHRPGEAPDSAAHDMAAVAMAIAVLLIIGFLASYLP
jgi:hypothetical protein